MMNVKTTLLICFVSLALCGSAYAQYEFDPTDVGVGARPLGMGKAFVALANDGSAIFMNPAGLPGDHDYKLISMGGSLMDEIPYSVAGAAFNVFGFVVGIGYVGVSASGIVGMELIGNTPEATGENADYANSTVLVNVSNSAERMAVLQDIAFLRDINLRLGIGVKFIMEGFSGGGEDFDAIGSGYDVDLSSIFDISPDISGALVIKNIMPGKNIGWTNSESELPMVVSPGLNWYLRGLNANVGICAEFIESRGLFWHLGGEWWPISLVAVRAGIDQKPSAGDVYNDLSFGLGTKLEGFTFDYAFHTYGDLPEFSTHYFSIGYMGDYL